MRRNDPACGRDRPCRRLNRGCDRSNRGPHLSVRSISGTGQSRSEVRAGSAFPVYADRQSREFPLWTPDLKDTIRRLEAFADAGADVLYAPGLKTREEIRAVVKAVAPKPVNVVMGLVGGNLSLDELADLGVKRVSVGSALARAAYGAFLRAAEEIRGEGSFTFAEEAVPYIKINALFKA